MTFSELLHSELSGWKRSEILFLAACLLMVTVASWQTDTTADIVCAVTGIISSFLNGKGKVSTYFFGIIHVVLYTYISFGEKFYGMAGLYVLYFLPMNIYGYYSWSRHIDTDTNEVEKLRLNSRQRMFCLLSVISLTCLISIFLLYIGGKMPFVDSFITALSVVAMICAVRRLMEQWAMWLVADAVTTAMWIYNYMHGGEDIATVLMWVTYLGLGLIMMVRWNKEVKDREQKAQQAQSNEG